MRASTLCLGLLLFATVAQAGPRKKRTKKKDSDVVDVSQWKEKFEVYTDGQGGYFIGEQNETDALFYGDGKQMYQQRVGSGGSDGGEWNMEMWSPRVDGKAEIDVDGQGAGTLTCGDDQFDLKKVDDATAAKIIDKATFSQPLWKRQVVRLSRDDSGTYYLVDRMRDEYGGKGYRLFAGQKGAMKELPLTNIVSDSVGQIFSSKRGELRYVEEGGKVTWIRGEQKTDLVDVPVEDNVKMIYGELGVYEGTLGTPCDDY